MITTAFIELNEMILVIVGIVYVAALYVIDRIETQQSLKQKPDEAASLRILSRKFNCSEYEVFRLATQSWNIQASLIDRHFNEYMKRGVLPYYVRDYLRKEGKAIEEYRKILLRQGNFMPFWFKW